MIGTRFYVALCAVLLSTVAFSQNTVGLLSYSPAQSYEGYNLIYPHNQPNVYLLNNCGEVVHTWTDSAQWRPGNTAYLRPDGSLVKTKRNAVVVGNPIWAGGGGAIIEIRDWNNALLWSFSMNDSLNRLHHDIAPMPNGNILAVAWEYKSEAEALLAGRDTANTAQDQFWPDWILEINPSTSQIVWEWHAWDHLIQDIDAAQNNFGVIANHPELIDINFEDGHNGHPDWMHVNAIDYNSDLDQIMISVPYFNELWVIDHTTTTAEAAGHSGGMAGKGGDLLYRWGNPIAYAAGDSTDQKLFFQHDTHWTSEFLTPLNPHWGKVALFNNRVGPDYSEANVLTPAWDMYSWSYTMTNGRFDPVDFDLTLQHPTPTALYSTGLSSVQCLPNGNSLITSGRTGYSFEMTPNNAVVWEYKTPLIAGQAATQGDSLTINQNLTFRMQRYPVTYNAFTGQNLVGQGWIELNPDTAFCSDIFSSIVEMDDYMIGIHPNPAANTVAFEWMSGKKPWVEVLDHVGKVVLRFQGSGGRQYVDISTLAAGTYFVRIENSVASKLVVVH